MGSLSTGGGSSAVAASAHAGCERYRHTDPLVIGSSRRKLAAQLGHPDTGAGIPEARWMRAMTFETLIRHERFVSQLLTTAVGALGLARPAAVRRVDAHVSVDATAKALAQAHLKAVHEDQATMVTSLCVPFVGMEGADATPVKPDFAIVVPRVDPKGKAVGSWLVMGDAKDYERVRSRIDDQRMLKGFLQVALGAESAAAWTKLPSGMEVHASGVLAVPRNAFLQPEAVVERLDDHRREVRARVDERAELMRRLGTTPIPDEDVPAFVSHLRAAFDPATCVTCSLFAFCRSELRASSDPSALLVELGVRQELRPALADWLAGDGVADGVPTTVVANIQATIDGRPGWTGQRRVDPAGLPGTVNVVLAKADAAALGIHGFSVQRIDASGEPTPWRHHVYDDPRSPDTRLGVMSLLGEALDAALTDLAAANPGEPMPVHVVMPDVVTGDVLVSIADSLAGIETSRLRWQRDLEMGRPALTWDGEEAEVPEPLTDHQRLAVSFLLEEDRARAMSLRWPLIDLRSVLVRHVIAGGPVVDHGRLDYLVEWADSKKKLRHRAVSDDIAGRVHTPGARLSNAQSDAVHRAGRRQGGAVAADADPARYRALVLDELGYKASIVDRAIAVLDEIEDSALRDVYRELERAAQEVWRSRVELHASDLVRFGRTSWMWRNRHVELLDHDRVCADQLMALSNDIAAREMALDAGMRFIALAEVVDVEPVRLVIRSRRFKADHRIVAIHLDGEPCIEDSGVTLKIQSGSFKFGQMHAGPLSADDRTELDGSLVWEPRLAPAVEIGTELIIADLDWLGGLSSNHEIKVDRPAKDTTSAPGKECTARSYTDDPASHQWCCKPHEAAEAEWADVLAGRRARGEMNPQAWPPVIDDDGFDTPAAGSPTDGDAAADVGSPPDDLTVDDVD